MDGTVRGGRLLCNGVLTGGPEKVTGGFSGKTKKKGNGE